MLTYLRRIGKVPTQLSHILLTHQHVDHVGGAAELAALSGAEVIAHPLDVPAIEGAAPRDMPKGPMAIAFRVALLPRLRPVAVTRQVTVGETLPVLVDDGGLQVIATPGHTRGQIAFYLPGRRLLFAGDTYRHTMRGEVAIPFRMFNRDTASARVCWPRWARSRLTPAYQATANRSCATPVGQWGAPSRPLDAPPRQPIADPRWQVVCARRYTSW